MRTKFKLGETVLAPYGKAEVLMIVGPRSDKPNQENHYSILYHALFSGDHKRRTNQDRVQEWRYESELRGLKR